MSGFATSESTSLAELSTKRQSSALIKKGLCVLNIQSSGRKPRLVGNESIDPTRCLLSTLM